MFFFQQPDVPPIWQQCAGCHTPLLNDFLPGALNHIQVDEDYFHFHCLPETFQTQFVPLLAGILGISHVPNLSYKTAANLYLVKSRCWYVHMGVPISLN